MIPGRILHRVAAYVCSDSSLERIVEPAIADLQRECSPAAGGWARVRYCARGYFSVFSVIAICALDVSDATSDERRAVISTFVWWLRLTFAIVVLLSLPWLWNYPIAIKHPYLAMTLFPQVLPLAIPIGLAFGIAFGLGRPVTMNAGKMILIAAALASLLSFGILEWALPASNQIFRDFTFQTLRSQGYTGPINGPPKGPNEMSIAELRHEIADAAASGESGRARRFLWALHFRFALSAAAVALAAFLLALRIDRRLSGGVLAFGACFLYYLLIYTGERAGVNQCLTPFAGAWLPNIVLMTAAIIAVSSDWLRVRTAGAR
jgi:hypothetical protein